MEPARSIIEKLGGPSAVSDIVGVHRTRVSNWMRPREKGGTGGMIPHWHVSKIIDAARAKGVELREVDFAPQSPSDPPQPSEPAQAAS